MSLVAEVQLSGPPITLPQAAAAVPNVTLDIESCQVNADHAVWYIWARGPDLDSVADAFRDLPNTEDVGTVSERDGERLYWISMSSRLEDPLCGAFREGMFRSGQVRPHCLHVTGAVSGRRFFLEIVDFLKTNDVQVSVLGLHHDVRERSPQSLTDNQLAALKTAHEMGYFEEGTAVTQEEVAAELGISRSALSERLRRAQRRLVEDHVVEW